MDDDYDLGADALVHDEHPKHGHACAAPCCLAPPGVELVLDHRGLCPWCLAEVGRIEAEAAEQVRVLDDDG